VQRDVWITDCACDEYQTAVWMLTIALGISCLVIVYKTMTVLMRRCPPR